MSQKGTCIINISMQGFRTEKQSLVLESVVWYRNSFKDGPSAELTVLIEDL